MQAFLMVGLALLATAGIKPLSLGLGGGLVTSLTLAAAGAMLVLFWKRCQPHDA